MRVIARRFAQLRDRLVDEVVHHNDVRQILASSVAADTTSGDVSTRATSTAIDSESTRMPSISFALGVTEAIADPVAPGVESRVIDATTAMRRRARRRRGLAGESSRRRSPSRALAARLRITKGDETRSWPSSFVGMIAIPDAVNQCTELYSALLAKLYADPDFRAARSAP